MLTILQTRLKRAGRLLPVALLPFTAHAQLGYSPANAVNAAGTYTDLAGTGTAIATANTDDANSAAQGIGFTFTYNGTAFTQFVLNTNGFIKLGATAPSAADLFLPESPTATQIDPFESTDAADVNILAPFNFDLTAGTAAGGTEYRVATTGTSPNRVCTIQWKNVADKTLEYDQQYSSMNFQVKLYETTRNIEFVYGPTLQGTLPDDYRFAVAGIKGSGINSGQTVLVTKSGPGTVPWSAAAFIDGFYTNDAFNYSGAVRPDLGRTYRFVPGAGPAPIANDNPTGAITLPLAAACTPTSATNVGATTTPVAGYLNPGCGIAVNPKDVWFKFATAAAGVGSTDASIQVTGTAAGQVRVFSATSSAGPFTSVGCAAGATNNTAAGALRLTNLTPNTTYYVSVSGYGSTDTQGPFTICAVGLASPPAPTYVTLPYTEGFENTWTSISATNDVPTAIWRNSPATGDNSWRREDDGFASAGWRYPDNEQPTTAFPIPPYVIRSSVGSHSARFHTFGTAAGLQGQLDLYVNMSAAGSKTLNFDYINPTGADSLKVFVSTDGGATFGATPVRQLGVSTAFSAVQPITIASTSATTVIRFRAKSDFGNDDLGIDNLRLGVVTATTNAALAATVGLYPNPAHQRFQLTVPTGLRTAAATLSNALGQVVQVRQLNLPAAGGTNDFNVSGLAPGIYTLVLKSGADLVVKRVVVE